MEKGKDVWAADGMVYKRSSLLVKTMEEEAFETPDTKE
jgi:hypothetical protein